ncbi:MAG: response regulator [Candidatus Scalindua sediminis]|nr:response regulator [Candidatus Scalindua sediminis]
MKTGKRILVVDDNTEFCENITDVLELEGYETVEVYDGLDALDAVKEDGFDLVLMDVKMPRMDGVETFRRLKEISPVLPVIMMSAFMVEDLIRLSLQEGAFGAYQKPLDLKRLFYSIERALPNGALIMIADDNEELCANLSDTLGEKGYRVTVAKNGETAVKMARENKFDVILMDMKLPFMDGLKTVMAIRNFRSDVQTIIITGHKEEMGDLIEQALQESAYTCMEKPLDMDHLLKCIQNILESDTRN